MEKKKITCLIVDDEPMALNLVESYVEKTPFLALVQKCASAIDALNYLNENAVDLLFLDIQMPDLTGIELSKVLPENTKVIFTTAFDQYALEGFKLDALDYLLKPFDYAEFLQAANKAKRWFDLVNNQSSAPTTTTKKEFIFVKSEYKQLKIQLNDILYFEGLKDYVKIYTTTQTSPILTLMSLKALEEELPEEDFMRIHRSFIVALNHIDAVERSQIIIGEKRITVSDQYKEKFQGYISSNSLD